MGELTRDQVLQKVRKNEKLERADLRGLDLSKAALSGSQAPDTSNSRRVRSTDTLRGPTLSASVLPT